MLIAHITDTHLFAPKGGESGEPDDGFDRAEALRRAVAAINALQPLPDLVIHTGDMVDKGEPGAYALSREILDELKPPLYLVPGNHDAREAMREAFIDLAHLDAHETYIQYTVEDYPLRLVGLDTSEPKHIGGYLCADRLAWIEKTLTASDHPVLIAMHHPPFLTKNVPFDAFGFEGLEAFRSLIARMPHVAGIICGHVHRAISTRLGSATVMAAPSTAYAYPVILDADVPLEKMIDPVGFTLHVWSDDGDPRTGLVSHVQALASTARRYG